MGMVGHRVVRCLVGVLMLHWRGNIMRVWKVVIVCVDLDMGMFFMPWPISIIVVALIVLVIFGVLRVFDAIVVVGTELPGELRTVVLTDTTKTMVSGRW